MIDIKVAYGREGLWLSLPDSAQVIASRRVPGVGDEAAAIHAALADPLGTAPLADLVRPGDTVAVVHSDITRATPNDRILPVLLGVLEAAGVARDDITLLNGLGTHRPQTPAELRTLLGDFVYDHYRCLQHDAFDDDSLAPLGETAHGHPVRINRHYLAADVRILTGFIEPHFFAGFSGGPKGVLPALAGAESVLSNHGWAMIGDERATWGVTAGNPIWEEMREVALRTAPTFLLNVTLNGEKQITGVFAGDLLAAHEAGCRFVRQSAMVAVDRPFDVVVTGNSGYPLDQNLYQAVKGMSGAARIVRDGGTVIMAAACEDGLPDHGLYAQLLAEAESPAAVLRRIREAPHALYDQWQVQIQALIQQRAAVQVYSDGLTDEQIRRAHFTPCRDIPASLEALQAGREKLLRVAVLPEGPQTVAYVK